MLQRLIKSSYGLYVLLFGVILLLAQCQQPRTEVILRLSGSNTMGAQLAPRLAAAYLQAQGATDVEEERDVVPHRITVSGQIGSVRQVIEINAEGTTTGLAGLADGTCDIALSSRPFNNSERANLLNVRRGDLSSNDNAVVIALDGIVVVGHPSIQADTLDVATLRDLLTGKITNWNALGYDNLPVRLLLRDENSGTRAQLMTLLFESAVPLTDQVASYATTAELLAALMYTPGAISFVSMADVGAFKPIQVIEAFDLPHFEPQPLQIALENYPFTRRLYFYLQDSTYRSPAIQDFVNFCLSANGQSIVQEQGFVSLNPEVYLQDVARPSRLDSLYRAQFPPAYRAVVAEYWQFPSTIRFFDNAVRVDNRGATDLQRLAQYLRVHPDHDVLLVGFSEAHAQRLLLSDLSRARAEFVRNALLEAGIEPHRIQTQALGGSYLIASNATPLGQQRNQRVEIWMRQRGPHAMEETN